MCAEESCQIWIDWADFSCVRNRKAYEDQALDTDLIQMELLKNNGVKDIVVNVTNQNCVDQESASLRCGLSVAVWIEEK